jgi:CRISPR-associated protein Csc1
MQVIEATIRTMGEVGFASREVGRLADTEPYVLNTALYYALGLAGGRYVDRKFEPTYIDDTEAVAEEVYVSPAVPVPAPGDSSAHTEYLTSTYNATGDEYATVNYSAQNDPNAKQNLPSYGRRRVLGHGNHLRCYLIPKDETVTEINEKIPQYIRLGKKRGKARVDTRLVDARRQTGAYQLGHPIGAYDYDSTPTGNVITKTMQPTPIILQAGYEGDHLAISTQPADSEDDDRFPRVCLPASLRFLETKR